MVSAAQDLHVFTDIVGATHVRVATAHDHVSGVMPRLVVSPRDEAEVAAVLAAATADHVAVAVRGGGTKLDWGSPPERCDIVVSTTRIAGVVDHEPADLVCVVRAGTTLVRLQEQLGSVPGYRQRLMLDPPQGANATVGGVVATAASGPLRTRFGTARDLVIGASFVLSDGTTGRSGGKVVKNVAGFDVAKLLVGSLGTLAVITEVAFRLHPLPAASRTVVFASRSPGELCAFAAAVSRLQVTPSIVDLHWPEGLVLARFDSSERGCMVQAEQVTERAGGRILSEQEALALATLLAASPWSEPGCIAAVAMLPSRVAEFMSSLSTTIEAAVLRPHLGTGEIRFHPDGLETIRAVLRSAGGRIVIRRGGGMTAGEPDDGVALDLMRSVKRQLDPARTLSPGRQVGGI
jgi:glycolate oxidase FAD binding subunit